MMLFRDAEDCLHDFSPVGSFLQTVFLTHALLSLHAHDEGKKFSLFL